jgi:hypothetical protein
MERHAFADLERPGEAVVAGFPALGERRLDLRAAERQRDEPFEHLIDRT